MISKQLQQLVILFINMTLPHPLGCHMLRNESTQHCVNSFVAATRRTFCFETPLGTNSTLKLWAWLCRCDSDILSTKFFTLIEMAGLRFYYDLMSQPSRAVFLFLKATNIPFVACKVRLSKGV